MKHIVSPVTPARQQPRYTTPGIISPLLQLAFIIAFIIAINRCS